MDIRESETRAGARAPFVEIDRAALAANWRRLAEHAANASVGAAVKADGYGLGLAPVATTLHQAGCRDFFVAWPGEGAAARRALGDPSARIYVLQGLDPEDLELVRRYDLTPVLSAPEDVALWAQHGNGRPAALQFETGMNRLGLAPGDAQMAVELVASGQLRIDMVMSHLASADDRGGDASERQRERFVELALLFPGAERSLANSAGLFRSPSFHMDLVRPGIALYGGEASLDPGNRIRPVATLFATVLQEHAASAGMRVGYGGTVTLARDSRLATVGIGYADGLPRSASSATLLRVDEPAPDFAIDGRRVPVLGRISMDMTILDVTDLPKGLCRPGALVEVFGRSVPVDETARRCGTIAYELLTGLGPRVTRRIV